MCLGFFLVSQACDMVLLQEWDIMGPWSPHFWAHCVGVLVGLSTTSPRRDRHQDDFTGSRWIIEMQIPNMLALPSLDFLPSFEIQVQFHIWAWSIFTEHLRTCTHVHTSPYSKCMKTQVECSSFVVQGLICLFFLCKTIVWWLEDRRLVELEAVFPDGSCHWRIPGANEPTTLSSLNHFWWSEPRRKQFNWRQRCERDRFLKM